MESIKVDDFEIRFKQIDGENWYIAVDIMKCLGYKKVTGSRIHVSKDNKLLITMRTDKTFTHKVTVINKAGVREYLLFSRIQEK